MPAFHMEKKKAILIALTALFFTTLVYRIMNPFQQQTISRLTYQSGQPVSAGTGTDQRVGRSSDPETGVMLELWMNPQRQPATVFRNIFEKRSVAADNAQPRTVSASSPEREPINAQSGNRADSYLHGLQQEISRFTAFGAYESDSARFVFLERNKDIYIVRKGDVIDGRFRIQDISNHAMTVQSETDGQSASIDISDIFSRGD